MHLEQDIINLANEFSRFRENKKLIKYPEYLWDQAIDLCKKHHYKDIAHALGVHGDLIKRRLRSIRACSKSF